ncbi:MAG: tyrosine-protein phosphatase [Hamadaea sp.]|uniref:tyrosine-protein phosphatase n=1 Tax=Hamadaea sp. TaxID=2024425 RepID=UPI00183863BB|nr:tyrosine-protein phosphatase [Hamadaea sp.]NUR74515.1 tyrosine-protein phosphatase [Hamadaea sp.]NUT20985.1 tyrosine-protein phosphatase [Hamadaea sp.]
MTIEATGSFIPFQAVFNFREVSGLPTADGARVRSRALYRSDTLSRLCDADRASFGELGVDTVIDLRRAEEIATLGRAPEWAAPAYHHRHLEHPFWRAEDYDPGRGVARYLADRYGELIKHGAADIAGVISLVAAPESGTPVVHCVAGKDRTGTVIALILTLLGVDEEIVAHEYALTELADPAFVAWANVNIPGFAEKPPVPYYVSTPPEAMLLTLREVVAAYGSAEALLTAAGLPAGTVDRLRAKLLE